MKLQNQTKKSSAVISSKKPVFVLLFILCAVIFAITLVVLTGQNVKAEVGKSSSTCCATTQDQASCTNGCCTPETASACS